MSADNKSSTLGNLRVILGNRLDANTSVHCTPDRRRDAIFGDVLCSPLPSPLIGPEEEQIRGGGRNAPLLPAMVVEAEFKDLSLRVLRYE